MPVSGTPRLSDGRSMLLSGNIAIRDSMPNFWGRRVIERNSGLTRLEEFDYQLQGADDRAGALGFGLNVEPPAPQRRFNRTLDLERLQGAADAIIADDPDLAGLAGRQVEELLLLATSMRGARPKAVVQEGHDLWIAKFSRQAQLRTSRVADWPSAAFCGETSCGSTCTHKHMSGRHKRNPESA